MSYLTEAEAQWELEVVLRDEPDWVDDLWIESFEFVVTADAYAFTGRSPGSR